MGQRTCRGRASHRPRSEGTISRTRREGPPSPRLARVNRAARRRPRNEGRCIHGVHPDSKQCSSEMLDGAGISSVAINGSMSIEERRQAQQAFRDDVRILVSTDAGGEGVNLQFAHVVVNYDLPWSPTRIEQRIGRVDRIGQARDVTAYNLVLESSIDARVIEVLQAKLAVILAELGADKKRVTSSPRRTGPSRISTPPRLLILDRSKGPPRSSLMEHAPRFAKWRH